MRSFSAQPMSMLRRLVVGLALALSALPFHARASSDPLNGYTDTEFYYTLPYANSPGFGANPAPSDPQIALSFGGNDLTVNLDTGSRGLYVSIDSVNTNNFSPIGSYAGQVYLNSSARIFSGLWYSQDVYFSQAVASSGSMGAAYASMPVLIVDTLSCSTTPPPGQTVAITTFRTIAASGSVTLTNGSTRSYSDHTLTLMGGESVSYSQNPGALDPVANFGVGFDRFGQGTSPNNDAHNQQYNAFLNISQMKEGSMTAGFILSQDHVQLGLTPTTVGYAYTDLLPTGYTQPEPNVSPDWQAPTGTLGINGETSGTGQVVVDIGINTGILTLPGQPTSGTASFTEANPLTVNLLNSNGAVSYQINDAEDNYLNPTEISWFAPLDGDFSENQPPMQDQFFNTGRNVLNAFDFLYDGENGFVGLKPSGLAVDSANIQFTAGYYPNPVPEPQLWALLIGAGLLAYLRKPRPGTKPKQ